MSILIRVFLIVARLRSQRPWLSLCLVRLGGSLMYDQDHDYRTRPSSSGRITLAWQRAHSSRHRAIDAADFVRLHHSNHRPGRSRDTSLDTL
jgi:hypothetical protein